MPCYDSRDDVRTVENPETKKRLDAATRAACEALTLLDSFKTGYIYIKQLSGPTQKWWEKHQEQDRRRKEAEKAAVNRARLKANAVAKLTAEERKALGI